MLSYCGEYIGFDPSQDAHNGLEKAANILGDYEADKKFCFQMLPFEKSQLEENYFDFALTSPPYFDVEQYHGDQQAHILYSDYSKWLEMFYTPMIEKTYKALKKTAYFCLNVSSQTYPLFEDGIKAAKQIGFSVEEIRDFGRGTKNPLHQKSKTEDTGEKIIILKK